MSRTLTNQIVSDDEGTVSCKSDDTSRITVSDDWHDVKEDNPSADERANKTSTPNQENYLPLLETAIVHSDIEHDDNQTSNDHQSILNRDSNDSTLVLNEERKQFFMNERMVPGSILINDRGEIDDSSTKINGQSKPFALSTTSMDVSSYGSDDPQYVGSEKLSQYLTFSNTESQITLKDDDEYDSNKNEGTSQVDQQASISKRSKYRNEIGNDDNSTTSPMTTETGDTVIQAISSNQDQHSRATVVSNQDDSIRSTPLPLSASQVVIEKEMTLDRMNSHSSNEKDSRIYANLDDMVFIKPAIPSQNQGVISWVSVHAPSSIRNVSMSNPSDSQILGVNNSSDDGTHTWKRSDWEGSENNTESQLLVSGIQSNKEEKSSQKGEISLSIVASANNEELQQDATIAAVAGLTQVSNNYTAGTNQSDPSSTIDALLSRARLVTPSKDPKVANSLGNSSSQERRSAFQVSKPSHSRPPLPSMSSLQSGPRSTIQTPVKLRGITVVGGDWAENRPPSASSTSSKLPSYYQRVYPSAGPSTPVGSVSCKPANFSMSPKPNLDKKTLHDIDPLPFTIDQNGVLHYRQTSSPTSPTMKTENPITRIVNTNIVQTSPPVSVPQNIQSYTNFAVAPHPLTNVTKETKPITMTTTNMPTAMLTTKSQFTITESELLDVQKALNALSRGESNIPTIPTSMTPEQPSYHQATNYNVLSHLADSSLAVKPEPIQWSRNITPLHQREVTPAILSNSPLHSVQRASPVNRPQSTTNSVLDQLTKISSINYI